VRTIAWTLIAAPLLLVRSAAGQGGSCASVVLQLRCLRRPPVYHLGERIRARLTFRSPGGRGYSLAEDPQPRRSPFEDENIVVEPASGAIDPSTRDPRIRAGNTLGSYWRGTKSLVRDIDVNEWLEFQRPGRYVLQAVSKRIERIPEKGESRFPPAFCELRSNGEAIEILPPDPKWEAAELARIEGLLGSTTGMTRVEAADDLRYLNTPAAASALVRWYVRLPYGDADTELLKGMFESGYPDIVQKELETALRSRQLLPADIAGTLAFLELRREYAGRPAPVDPKAAGAWSREYWDRYAALKREYSAVPGQPAH
jgi:hypothetical protein